MDADLSQGIALFGDFFDAIGLSVAIIDQDGRYAYYNQECSQLDEYTAEQALGAYLLELYPELDENSSTLLQALRQGRSYRNHYQRYRNPRGKAVHQVHTTLPLKRADGRIVGAVELSRDLTVVSPLHQALVDLQQNVEEGADGGLMGIITDDAAMKQLIHQARRLARADVQVLIHGETGTGKELFARLLHQEGPRAERPFVVLNCAALPEPLFESTLFGTVRGAFTGAEDRRGVLESAHGGTLFLDEINSLPLSIQGKLLRALQEGTFSRVGSGAEVRVDVRVVAASNESPQRMLDERKIRPDLLYRLNVGCLAVPPLRERLRDIPLLAQAFLRKHGKVTGHRVQRISHAVMERMLRYHWPGNVRMLENVLLRSLILCEGGDELDFLLLEEEGETAQRRAEERRPSAPAAPPPDGEGTLEQRMAHYERRLLVDCLEGCANLTEAARRLGLPRATLQYKLKKHGIQLARTVLG